MPRDGRADAGHPCAILTMMARTRRPRSGGTKQQAGAATQAAMPSRDPWQDAAGPGAGVEREGAVAEDPAAKLAAELAGLPPAERYERLIDFPTDHTFKVIGVAEQAFTDRLRAALADLGYPEVTLQPRYSSGANYVAYTVTLTVASGAAMVRIYEGLGALAGLKYLL
jgi:putative lipoic acid-binding regulatory protein